jgi:hypothetical protein
MQFSITIFMAITATISRTAVIPLVVAYIEARKEVLHHTQNLLVLFKKVLTTNGITIETAIIYLLNFVLTNYFPSLFFNKILISC